MTSLTEADVEEAALAWLSGLGWDVAHGPDIAPDAAGAERSDYGQVILARRLRDALARLNSDLPSEALEGAFRRLTRPEGATLEARNRAFHRMLVDGVTVEYRAQTGTMRGAQARVIDVEQPTNNHWLAVNQFTVTENKYNRRPDVVLFVNGLPLGVIELKNPTDEDATVWTAWQQLQTYKAELPTLFSMNEMLMVSDGTQARIGTLTAGKEWFKPWRTITGEALAEASMTELQVMLEGACARSRFLALVRDFIVFEDDGSGALTKKMAGYHQFHAVGFAVGETLRAAELQQASKGIYEVNDGYETGRNPGGEPGDRRIGVVWHTQGSGKSLTMAFYAGAIVREQAMENPTVVVLTDRNDLDDQLFGTFSRCQDILRQPPAQAENRADLRSKLSLWNAGGVVFHHHPEVLPGREGATPIPTLSERRNIVVIADEAHRSQYDFIDGYARHMRDASAQCVIRGLHRDAHRATGRQHACRVRRLHQQVRHPAFRRGQRHGAHLLREPLGQADPGRTTRSQISTPSSRRPPRARRWTARRSSRPGGPNSRRSSGRRTGSKQIAEDIVDHFDQRVEALEGKAMIVCMSRRICIDLYRELIRLRLNWHDEDDGKGAIKVVMTGSASDPLDWQPHIRNKPRREALANRFRDPDDPSEGRSGAGHVAHRIRRAESAHHVCRQADARPWADAGHRPG